MSMVFGKETLGATTSGGTLSIVHENADLG
jgi:hypothetical protein